MASKIIKKNRGNTRTKAWLNTQLKKIVPADKNHQEDHENDHDEEDEDKSTEDFLSLEEFKEDAQAASEPEEPSVVYIGHLPFGFEEYQLSDFFKQFGEVKRSFVSRSTKTGRSRGYAFVEFHNPTVAQIAADTMNDYLMFRKRLVCRMVPALAAVKIRWPAGAPVDKPLIHTQKIAAMYYNMKNKTEPVDKLIERENKKRERLRKRGIDYEFDGYTELVNKLKQGKKEEKKEEKKVEETKETPQNGDVDPKKRKREEEWEQRKQVKIAAEKTDKQKKRDAQLQAKAEKVEKRKEAKAAHQQKDTTPKKEAVVSAPTPKKDTPVPKKDIVVTKKDIAAVIPKDTIALKEAADAAAAAAKKESAPKKATPAPKKETPAPKKETATPQKETPKKAPVTKANVSAKKKQTSK